MRPSCAGASTTRPMLPGRAHPDRGAAAWQAGASAVKLFPASTRRARLHRAAAGPVPATSRSFPPGACRPRPPTRGSRPAPSRWAWVAWLIGDGEPSGVEARARAVRAAVDSVPHHATRCGEDRRADRSTRRLPARWPTLGCRSTRGRHRGRHPRRVHGLVRRPRARSDGRGDALPAHGRGRRGERRGRPRSARDARSRSSDASGPTGSGPRSSASCAARASTSGAAGGPDAADRDHDPRAPRPRARRGRLLACRFGGVAARAGGPGARPGR